MVVGLLQAEIDTPESPVADGTSTSWSPWSTAKPGARRILDAMLRPACEATGFGADPDGLSLAKPRAHPHGIDFGPLEPPSARSPPHPRGADRSLRRSVAADLLRLRERVDEWAADERLRLVGRRHLRSNNSWMHSIPVLVKGKVRLHVAGPSRRRRSDSASRRRPPGCGPGSARSWLPWR
ncbi:MAG: hypothetical protein R2695_16340 [Acidimicrobiales bacterium]